MHIVLCFCFVFSSSCVAFVSGFSNIYLIICTTPLEIAVRRNKTDVVQLLIQKKDLKRSEFCINEQTGKEDCQTQDRNHRHLPYSMWHIITESNNDYLTHLLKIGWNI